MRLVKRRELLASRAACVESCLLLAAGRWLQAAGPHSLAEVATLRLNQIETVSSRKPAASSRQLLTPLLPREVSAAGANLKVVGTGGMRGDLDAAVSAVVL